MPLGGVVVRPFSTHDLADVRELYETALREPLAGPFLLRRYGHPDAWLPIDPEARPLLTAEYGGSRPGFLMWRQDETLAVVGPVVVARSMRRFGIAGALLADAVQRLRGRGLRIVEARLPRGDPASAQLFTSAGFRPVAVPHVSASACDVCVERVFQRRRAR